MKKIGYLLLVLIASTFNFKSLAENIWVSDEIKAPLYSEPKLNSKIIGLLKAGQQASVLEKSDKYVKIKTFDGKEGWLSNYYVLRQKSVHEQLSYMKISLNKAKKEVVELKSQIDESNKIINNLQLDIDNIKKDAGEIEKRAKLGESGVAKLTTNNKSLQKNIDGQNKLIKKLATALDKAKKKATDARMRYISLVKVSENAVNIDKQNRELQKKSVQFEQQIQKLKTENQSLKSQIGKKEFIIGALTVLGGIVVGYLLSVMMPPRDRRRSVYRS